jgi:branched-chain amino acid transport system ATP-binding protein
MRSSLKNTSERWMLEARKIKSGYGGVTVLDGLEFDVKLETFAVLGANGAGKTTLLRTLARLMPLVGGELHWNRENVTRTSPFDMAERGVAYVPQERNVFPDLTVGENLSIGGLVGRRSKRERLDEVFELFPDLADRIDQSAGSLSGGEGQMVAVARALMQDPKIILLDEPTAGLSPRYVDILFDRIKDIQRSKGVAVVLAEQNASKTLQIADRVMILSLGKIHLIDDAIRVDMHTVREGYRI